MACGKTKMNCIGAKQFAECIQTQIQPPSYSDLFEDECLTVEEVLEDLYKVSGEIKEDVSIITVNTTCFTEPAEKTITSLFQQLYTELCALKTTVTTQQTQIETQQSEIEDLQNNNCP